MDAVTIERWPVLRPEVRVDLTPDGAGSIADPIFGRRIRLDPKGMALVSALRAGPATTDELAARVGAEAAAIAPVLGRLLALDLLSTPRALARVAERHAQHAVMEAPERSLRPLAGARFGCTMCGSCCGGHNVGPVSEHILEGLAQAAEALEGEVARARHVDKGLFFGLPGAHGEHAMCHASAGSCVFLDDEGRCRIHARLGGDKKPLPCRVFPWELVVTPTGVRVAVQRECRDFSAATAVGQPTLDEACEDGGEVATLVAELVAHGGLPSVKPVPVLRGEELATWADYERLEQELLAVVDHGWGPHEVLPALARLLGADPHGAQPGDGERAKQAFLAWRTRLLGHVEAMLGQAPAPDTRRVIRVDALVALQDALRVMSGWVLGRALGPLDEPGLELFHAHVRHALWSVSLARAPSLETGLARLVSEWLLARVIAISRARTAKRFHVTQQDLQDGLTLATFLFRHDDLQPVLGDVDASAVACFVDGVVDLWANGPRYDAPDSRLELVKF